jgi:hypothetical protein
MDISILRDYVIVIGGFLLLISLILVGVFSFIIYRDIKSLRKSIKDTLDTVKQIGPNIKQSTGFFKIIIDAIMGKKTARGSKPSDNAE